MAIYSARDFISEMPSQEKQLSQAAVENSEQLKGLYEELWLKLLREVMVHLLKDAIQQCEQAIKKEWYLLWPSKRRTHLDSYCTRLRTSLLQTQEDNTCSFLRHNPFNSDNDAAYLLPLGSHVAPKTWLNKFLPQGCVALNSAEMTQANITELSTWLFAWAPPLAGSMQIAADALYPVAKKACQTSTEFDPLRQKFNSNIPSYASLNDESKLALENSYMQIEYPKWRPLTSTTPSAKKELKQPQPIPSLLDIKQPNLQLDTFYTAIANHLNPTATASITDKAGAIAFIGTHAKKGSMFSWKPSEETTLLRLLEAAEKPTLSEQEWQDAQRRLQRLATYTRKNGQHTAVPQHEPQDGSETYFNNKRYGDTNLIFNQNTTLMRSSLDAISHEGKATAYKKQLSACCTSATPENATLEDIVKTADTARETYDIPNDANEMMRQLYFILLKHQRGHITDDRDAIFDMDIRTGVFSFTTEDDQTLAALVKSQAHNDFAFSILLLTKVLVFITNNHAEQYNLIRDTLIASVRAGEAINFASFDFSATSKASKDLNWLKQYLPAAPVTKPGNSATIAEHLEKMLPFKMIPTSPNKAIKGQIVYHNPQDTALIDELATHAISIIGNPTKQTKEDMRDIYTASREKRPKSSITDLKIYMLCKYYIQKRRNSSTYTTSAKDLLLMTHHCGKIMEAVEDGKLLAEVTQSPELQHLLRKKGADFSGARLLKTIDDILSTSEEPAQLVRTHSTVSGATTVASSVTTDAPSPTIAKNWSSFYRSKKTDRSDSVASLKSEDGAASDRSDQEFWSRGSSPDAKRSLAEEFNALVI